jgi:glucose/mannose transport system substrate-binding protein
MFRRSLSGIPIVFSYHWIGKVKLLSQALLARRRAPWVVALLSSIASGCGGVEVLGREEAEQLNSCQLADYEGAPPETVVFASFWTDDAESKALEVLELRGGALGPTPSRQRLDDRASQQQTLKEWLTTDSGSVPDSFQVNGGSDVLQWVYDKGGKDSELCPLDDLARRYDMSGRYFEAALSPVSCDEHLFAAPIGVHRLNALMYNRAALALVEQKASEDGDPLPSVESLTSSEAFFDYLERVKSLDVKNDDGIRIVPLSVGHSGTWPLTILAFDNMLAGSPGAVYEATWMGRPNGETDEELRPAFEQLASQLGGLASLSNLDKRLSWQDATRAVGQGNALFLVMGDWALAQLEDNERDDVEIRAFPGTEDTFVYTPDSFSVPRRDGDNGAAARLWIHGVLDDKATQLAFAARKQAIPAIRGLDNAALEELKSEYLEKSYRTFAECQEEDSGCRLLLAVSGLAPPPGSDACFDEVGYLLSRITGVESEDEIDGVLPGDERTCPTPLPSSPDEAKEQLVDLLLEVSRTAYAAKCR